MKSFIEGTFEIQEILNNHLTPSWNKVTELQKEITEILNNLADLDASTFYSLLKKEEEKSELENKLEGMIERCEIIFAEIDEEPDHFLERLLKDELEGCLVNLDQDLKAFRVTNKELRKNLEKISEMF